MKRGLTQGNPLSAFLFIILIQPLVSLIAGLLDRRQHEIIRAFADDVAIVLPSVLRSHFVLSVFIQFGLASGRLLHPHEIKLGIYFPP